MHTLVSKLVALSVEKYYMALTEIQLKICRFHGSLSQKGSRPLGYNVSSPITTLFLRSWQNSYILRAFEVGYNNFGDIVTSPMTSLFLGPRRIFCSFNRVEEPIYYHGPHEFGIIACRPQNQ